MDFKYVENTENIFKGKHYLKSRDLSIIEFNMRLFDMVSLNSVPFMEKINFLKIINSNLEEFISVRLPRIKASEVDSIIHTIEELYIDIGSVLDTISSNLGLDIESEIELKEIPNKNIKYIYAGENDEEVKSDIDNLILLKNGAQIFTLLYAGDNDKEFYDRNNVEYIIHCPKSVLSLDKYSKILQQMFENNNGMYYPKNEPKIYNINYYTKLLRRDLLIRNPYESYDNVVKFIQQMCVHPNIHTIFITLYRTADESKIVDALIKATGLDKNVFVFVEPTARDNEQSNIDIIERLKKAGVHVKYNYFNYKVHCKLFCAIDDNFIKYVHVGTGNYNESTGRFYTDFHLMTTDETITSEVLKIMMSIFEKTVYKPFDTEYLSVFASPTTFREEIYQLIDEEEEKGEEGRIWIKCNNMCDCSVINKLYSAAEAGVQIYIICRTGCSIYPHENIHIRSKVGQYLEHDRFYVFGDRVFISSADLLLRNISKRVEVLCEILDEYNADKIEDCFINIWNSNNIHELQLNGRWKLLE